MKTIYINNAVFLAISYLVSLVIITICDGHSPGVAAVFMTPITFMILLFVVLNPIGSMFNIKFEVID